MGITIFDLNKMIKKATSKKDGVYQMNPYIYAVRGGKLLGYCEYSGDVYQTLYGFTTHIGNIKYRGDQKRELKRVFNIK